MHTPTQTLADYCRGHHIRRLAQFGSALRGTARPGLSRHFRDEVQRTAELRYAA